MKWEKNKFGKLVTLVVLSMFLLVGCNENNSGVSQLDGEKKV